MNCVLHDLNVNYGWEHFWCDPGRNALPKEYVKGPFSNPKIACPFPYISLSQTEGELLRIRSGVPDCWGDYLIRQLLGDYYDSMHKEDADIAHKLRKDYRLYLGQGIPNPWITPPLPHSGVVSCKGLKENLRNYIFHVSENRKKNRNCFSCEKNCLLECPDKTNRCTCKSCHSKDVDFGSDCKCIEILQNWVSENIHLSGMRERKGRKKRSKFQGGSSDSSGCETDDEGTNASSEKTCLCPKIFRIALGSISSANSNVSCIERQSKHEEYIFSKDVLYEDCTEKKGFGFFPYKKGIYRGNKHLRFKYTNAASKQVQTETHLMEETKTVQTENGGDKIQLSNKCFRCTMHEHQQTTCRINPLEKTMCISPGFVSNHAVICPYTCCDHLLDQKPYWVSAFERKKQKKKKQSSKEAYAGERHFEEDNVLNTCTESDGFKTSDAPKHASSIKINNPMDYRRPCRRSFDNLKYLTDSRLKNYLRERETLRRSHCRTSQVLNEAIKPGSLVREPSLPVEKLEKFGSLRSKPNLSGSSYAGNPRKKDTYVAWPGYVDRGVMTGAGEETSKKEVITKYFKDAVESDESRTYGLIRSSENNRKRRKLVSSRKRRRTGGRKKTENGMPKLVNTNTELGPGELAGHPTRNNNESRSDFKYKQIASRKPEKETFAVLLKRPLRGEHYGNILEKISPVKSRRSPDVMKFITGDLLVDEKSKT